MKIPFAQLLTFTEVRSTDSIDKILVESTAGTTAYEADEAGLLKAIYEAESGSTIDILSDINITSQIDITKSLTLKSSNGSSIKRQQEFDTKLHMLNLSGSNITVTLKDIIIDGNNISEQYAAVHVNDTNHLIIENGTIIKNNCSSADIGGGIFNAGTLTINGGEISNNTATLGGGISNNGTLTINGGKISNNTAKNGGGVYNYGIFTLNNGMVSNNTATADGGGIKNEDTFTMKDATISNNTAEYGGGVYNSSTFTMEKGTISNDTATITGGGVFNDSIFTMNSGTISDNNAKNGGGVLNNKTFTMKDGTVSNNTASYYGGGVSNYSAFTMEKGTISHNSADRYGGGVYNSPYGSFVACNSSFIGNANDAILAANTVNLFHCTVADNTRTCVLVDNTNKPYTDNGIITGTLRKLSTVNL